MRLNAAMAMITRVGRLNATRKRANRSDASIRTMAIHIKPRLRIVRLERNADLIRLWQVTQNSLPTTKATAEAVRSTLCASQTSASSTSTKSIHEESQFAIKAMTTHTKTEQAKVYRSAPPGLPAKEWHFLAD